MIKQLNEKIKSCEAIREALIFAMRHPDFKSDDKDSVYEEIGSLTGVIYEAEQNIDALTGGNDE